MELHVYINFSRMFFLWIWTLLSKNAIFEILFKFFSMIFMNLSVWILSFSYVFFDIFLGLAFWLLIDNMNCSNMSLWYWDKYSQVFLMSGYVTDDFALFFWLLLDLSYIAVM